MPVSFEQYRTKSFTFPPDDINPANKDAAWCRKWAEAIFSLYIQGKTAIPYSHVAEMKRLRDLADGRQDVLQYQKILLDLSENDRAIEGWMNINWDVISVMPKFLRIVEGIMEQTDHQVIATAVDPASSEEKEVAKLNMAFRMKFREQLKMIDESLGLDSSGIYVPESIEELNLYEGAGGFKLAKETEIEQGLDYTFYISDWKEIKKKLIRDLCSLGCICTKDYVDIYTKKVKVRYCDPVNFIGQYSSHPDHKNMEYAGEIIQVSISDLRKNTDIPENELRNLASQYNGHKGNILLDDLRYYEDSQTSNYDNFLVDVFDAEWMSVNSKYMTTRKTKYDNDMVYEEEWGKVWDTDKKKTEKFDIKTVYRCKWVIGTNYVYDYGLQYDIPRPGKKEVALSYHFYKLPHRSMVSLAEPHLHQIALTFFRLQNAIAQASPAGIAIEYTALQNMVLGGSKLEPLELIKIKKQTGDLIFKATTHKGIPNTPGGYRPIQELVGGIGPQLNEFITIFNFNIEAIRELTGINKMADASTPNPNVLVGVSEIAVAATNNALRPIYSAYLAMKENVAKNIALRLQLLIKNSKEAYEGYMPVIGRLGVQIIRIGADIVDVDYHIKYEARPTKERKETIRQAAINAMNPDKNGIIGIELADFLMVERYLESGNLKYAEAFLNYKTKKNKERQLQLQRENMLLDKQREQEAIQIKAQLEQQRMQSEIEKELRIYEGKKMIDDKYLQKEHARKKELLGLKSTLGIVEKAAERETITETV